MGELSVNDSEQTEGEHLAALGIFKPFPFRHGYAATLSPAGELSAKPTEGLS